MVAFIDEDRSRDPDRRPERAKRGEKLRGEVRRVRDGNFAVRGAEKAWRQLRREEVNVARCTVERLMRATGLRGAVSRYPALKPIVCPLPGSANQGRRIPYW
jgi:hypothetical protein